jgi:hypothetical protein
VVLGKPLVVVSTLLALVAGVVPAAAALAERAPSREVPPGLTLSAPPTYAGAQAPVTVTLADEAGEPRPVDAREAAHLAVVVHCARAGVWAVRVHDVGSACDALAAWAALEDPTSGAGG